jgi:hypothetical protein
MDLFRLKLEVIRAGDLSLAADASAEALLITLDLLQASESN